MSLTVTVLGCGASAGVPMIGCDCAVCLSHDPKNKRSRVSVLVEEAGHKLLIDVPPDVRQHCLTHGISTVDSILFTHAHADHCHGIDDLRPLNYNAGAPIPAYADPVAMEELQQRFGYAFKEPIPEYGWFRPSLTPHLIDLESWPTLHILPQTPIQMFPQLHGKLHTVGMRIGSFAYSTDVNYLTDEALELLQGIDTWLVDCLRREPSPTHAHLELALEWIAKVKPRRAILTHMSHEFDYESFCAELPEGVEPAYDGMRIELN